MTNTDAGELHLTGGQVLLDGELRPADLVVRDGVVAEIAPPAPGGPHEPSDGASVLDVAGQVVAPGFVELQINGAHGHDFTSDPTSVWRVGAELPAQGVTAFLPTIVSSPGEVVSRSFVVFAAGPPAGYRGARVLGLHLEGPMLSPNRRGAHNPSQFRLPSFDLIAGWEPSAGVRLVTLAPELPGAADVTRELVSRGVVVSAGHSSASFEQARDGFAAGITLGTHLYNAMLGFGHRFPGLTGALLATPGVPASVIADGVHVHPGAIEMAWQAKGPEGLVLITDAIAGAGRGDGSFRFGDYYVEVENGRATLPDGTLAGSVLTLDVALRNLVAATGCSLADALATVTSTPADVLGEGQVGRIEVGLPADLVVLDADLRVTTTLVAGEVVHDDREPFEQDVAPTAHDPGSGST
ncbi:MAG: N-acetylglucosamine-6-phosphate deacetylase [Nitriliruptorales bacterium]